MRTVLTPYALFAGLCAAVVATAALAADRILTLTFEDSRRSFTAAELLARPDVKVIDIDRDPSYRRAMTYRAVPALALIGADAVREADTIEARASDGFVAQIPAELFRKAASGGAVPWIAIEDADAPWPPVPGKAHSAGPFYLVWEGPERSGVVGENWPYALAALTAVERPDKRWPQIAVDPALPADAAERRGQASYIANCLPCHRMNGAGEGDMGPDLGQPMNVTRYMTGEGLRALIRDPKAVRTWPAQQMVGFGPDQIPDRELDDLIAFLAYMAVR